MKGSLGRSAGAEGTSSETVSERIVREAITYLLEVGPQSFETRELANRMSITQSQVNYYFGSRDGLLVTAAAQAFSTHVDEMVMVVESHPDPYAGVMAWLNGIIDYNARFGVAAVMIGFPGMFTSTLEDWRREGASASVLDASERIGTVLFSAVNAIHRDKPYRRLNRATIGALIIARPRVANAVTAIGMAAGGFAQVWAQHQERPIFGYDPRKSLRRAVGQILDDLAKTARPDLDDDEFFAD